jgi:hypothetical protein
MVRRRIFPLLTVLLTSSSAYAVTPEELRQMSGETDRQEQQRANRANTGDPASLLPPPKAGSTSGSQPQSGKYGTPAKAPRAVPASGGQTTDRPASQAGDDKTDSYNPPARPAVTGKDAIYSDSVPLPKVRFGIRLGTWFEATLDRNTSSAEPGQVELHVTQDVIGDKRTLKAGSLLYASKGLNGSTKRLELRCEHGITPDGHEFSMRGLVFDPQKVSGLNGIMQVDGAQIAKHSATNAALSAVAAGARTVMPSAPVGAAVRGATETALTDTNRGTEFNNAMREVIYVSPQPVLIRVEELF